MAPVTTICPVCKQRLMLQDYMALVGSEVVCNNCETNLRVESQRPFRVAVFPIDDTYNADMRPESYG